MTGLALPRDLAGPLDPEALAAAEVAIAAAVVAYAEQASGSRLSPSRISPIFAAEPEVADPGEALAETAAAPDPGARLAAFNPPQKGYRALRDALRRMDDAARRGGVQPDGAEIDLGSAVSDAPAFGDDPLLGAAGGSESRPPDGAPISPPPRPGPRATPRRASAPRSSPTWRCGAGSRATWASGASRSTFPTSPSR